MKLCIIYAYHYYPSKANYFYYPNNISFPSNKIFLPHFHKCTSIQQLRDYNILYYSAPILLEMTTRHGTICVAVAAALAPPQQPTPPVNKTPFDFLRLNSDT